MPHQKASTLITTIRPSLIFIEFLQDERPGDLVVNLEHY